MEMPTLPTGSSRKGSTEAFDDRKDCLAGCRPRGHNAEVLAEPGQPKREPPRCGLPQRNAAIPSANVSCMAAGERTVVFFIAPTRRKNPDFAAIRTFFLDAPTEFAGRILWDNFGRGDNVTMERHYA